MIEPRVHEVELRTGIRATPEFDKKGLAQFSVNVGTKCGHDCTYCSTGTMLRMHPSFRHAGENPFGFGYAIVDPTTPTRVASDAQTMRKRGVVQLCTVTDAWAPEAQLHQLGRRCLDALLAQPGWTVRILTKNAAVQADFDTIEQHRDRVSVGLSVTAPLGKSAVVQAVEPNASSLEQRIAVMREAKRRGLRTYAMLCPLLPGVADAPQDVDELVQLAVDIGAEEIFVEPVNARGPGLRLTEEALRNAGFKTEADAVHVARSKRGWSPFSSTWCNQLRGGAVLPTVSGFCSTRAHSRPLNESGSAATTKVYGGWGRSSRMSRNVRHRSPAPEEAGYYSLTTAGTNAMSLAPEGLEMKHFVFVKLVEAPGIEYSDQLSRNSSEMRPWQARPLRKLALLASRCSPPIPSSPILRRRVTAHGRHMECRPKDHLGASCTLVSVNVR